MTVKQGSDLIVLIPGLALPRKMGFLLEYCRPVKHTLEAIRAGHLLKIDHHPPYVQLVCNDLDRVIMEARRKGLRIYRGKRHITITDGVYSARIYLDRDQGD